MYYPEMDCICSPQFQTNATEDVMVVVKNDTYGEATLTSRSYGAWGCHGSIYPGHVCQSRVVLPPGHEWTFYFNSRGHCNGFFIVPNQGESKYFLLKTKQTRIRVGVWQMIKEGSPTDPIGKLGCMF